VSTLPTLPLSILDLAPVGEGATSTAGLAVGFWSSTDEIRANWTADRRWEPAMDAGQRAQLYADWKKAVTKTFGWVEQPAAR
jgi:glycerol kinase